MDFEKEVGDLIDNELGWVRILPSEKAKIAALARRAYTAGQKDMRDQQEADRKASCKHRRQTGYRYNNSDGSCGAKTLCLDCGQSWESKTPAGPITPDHEKVG